MTAEDLCPHCGREPIPAFGEKHGWLLTAERDGGHPEDVGWTVCIDDEGGELEPEADR